MMLPRLSRALSSSSKGFYPLITHLHDGVCFVLRSRPRDGADDGRYGFVHGPPTGALTLTLANHPALPSRLDEASYEDLRNAYAHKATVAEDTVIDWRSGGGGQSFFEKLSERFGGRSRGPRQANVVFYLDEEAGRLISMELPLDEGIASHSLVYAPRGDKSRSATDGEPTVTLQSLPNTSREFSGIVTTRVVPANGVLGGWPVASLASANRELRLLRPIIRKMWPDPVESLEFVRTVNGEIFVADDESKLIDVAPDGEEDLSIEVNGTPCALVME
jgi:hypothetical protein